eukprot:g34520.t1
MRRLEKSWAIGITFQQERGCILTCSEAMPAKQIVLRKGTGTPVKGDALKIADCIFLVKFCSSWIFQGLLPNAQYRCVQKLLGILKVLLDGRLGMQHQWQDRLEKGQCYSRGRSALQAWQVGVFTSAAGKDNLQRKDTHFRLGKIKHLFDTETASKSYFNFAYSYYSSTTEEVEVSLARPEYFFSFLPPDFEANIESKHLNPLGELKGDLDDSCPKKGGKFVDRMTRYCQRSHQQTNLLPATSSPSSTLPTSTSSSSTSSVSSVVSSLPENSGPSPAINQLRQSLAERARSTHEIAGLKDQLSLMEQKYDTERSLCAAAVDKQRSIETKAKQELTDLKTKHAAEVASMDQQIKNLKKDVDRLTDSSASQNDDLLATQDNLVSLGGYQGTEEASRERVLREYRKKITEAKKTGSQAAHEVTEERDELLVEIEDANAQASHFKERGDRLAKELAAAKRATKKLQLKLDDAASSSCKGKRSRSDSEAQSEESVDQEETGGEESCDSSDVDDKFQPPSRRHGDSGKKEKRDREKGGVAAASYSEFIAPLIKATQEISSQMKILSDELKIVSKR